MVGFSTSNLFCFCTDRSTGVKVVGFLYFVWHFLELIWPVYEINVFRANQTWYENSTTFANITLLQNGGYENLLVFGIIFFLAGIVCSAILVWATMQVHIIIMQFGMLKLVNSNTYFIIAMHALILLCLK